MPKFPSLPAVSPDDLSHIADFLRRHAGDPAAADRREIVRSLALLWQTTGFIAPFDWQAWLRQHDDAWAVDPTILPSATLETLRRLITAHVRTNRFVEGHLEGLVASGYIAQALDRLRQIVDERA